MATFNQQNQSVSNQYNADAINFGPGTKPDEMADKINMLKREISALPGLPEETRENVIEALDSAKGSVPSVANTSVKERLDNAGAMLESAQGAGEKALNLAQMIFKVGNWVIAAL